MNQSNKFHLSYILNSSSKTEKPQSPLKDQDLNSLYYSVRSSSSSRIRPIQISQQVLPYLSSAEPGESESTKSTTSNSLFILCPIILILEYTQPRYSLTRYQCMYCPQTLASKNGLIVHLRRHFNEYPYSCSYCSRKCRTKDHLKRHVRIHTGEKPYPCLVCNRKFVSGTALKYHRETRKHRTKLLEYYTMKQKGVKSKRLKTDIESGKSTLG